MKKGKKQLLIKIMALVIIILVLAFAFLKGVQYVLMMYFASQHINIDTFTAEEEESLRDYFNITLVDDMELVWARFAGGSRDQSITIWYMVKGNVNNLLELNPYYVVDDNNTSIVDYHTYQPNSDGNLHENNGPEYHWDEGEAYMAIYEENDYHIVVFYTAMNATMHEAFWDTTKQVFYKEQDE